MYSKWVARLNLRDKVLAVLLPGMLIIIAASLWLTRVDALDAANAAFDRSLLGAIKSVELNTSMESGGLAVELPYRLFEFFQLTASGTVYFRVATADGLVEIGNPDLPQPEEAPELGVPAFFDANYLGEAVRVGTYIRPLERSIGDGVVQHLVIQVAETVESRREFTRGFLLRAAVRDVIVISAVCITLALLLTLLLRPVSRLAAQVRARQPSDLRPLEARDLPRDIQPLVDAVNQQLARTRQLIEQQRNFVDDASHQLRTPLATLHAQVGYALRQQDSRELASTLISIAKQLEVATRSTNQLLALARTDTTQPRMQAFDLGELVREVGTRLLAQAGSKGLDFGVEVPGEPCLAEGDRDLLAEAASNLAHNAVLYAEEGGRVTLAAQVEQDGFSLKVVNTGAAMPEHILARVGQRFLKGQGTSGAGLGLAIAKSIIDRHGGWLRFDRLDDLGSNCAWLWWPRTAAEHPGVGR